MTELSRSAAVAAMRLVLHHGQTATSAEATDGRMRLCNAHLSSVGRDQRQPCDAVKGPPFLTSGDDLRELGRLPIGRRTYGTSDVVTHLLASPPPSCGLVPGAVLIEYEPKRPCRQ